MNIRILPIILALLSISLCISLSKTCIAQETINNQELPRSIPLLALSRTNLSTETSKPGDPFSAKLVENMKINDQLLIPLDSIVYGTVTEVKKPKRYPLRNGAIRLSIEQIETPQGQKISLNNKEVSGNIISPQDKSIRRRFYEAAPIRASGYGVSIPLSSGTNMGGGAVYAISLGANIATGLLTGFAIPDAGRSRAISSWERAVDSTPVGGVRAFVAIGQHVGIKTGDGIILGFDKKTIEKIQSQLTVQPITQTQNTTSK